MTLYAESSAILSWLLGEEETVSITEILARSDYVFTSRLTLVECDRGLWRAAADGRIDEINCRHRRALLAQVSLHWALQEIDERILSRARQPFPKEPVRSLDALHLASALETKSLASEVAILTLDHRIRANAENLGFNVLPD